MTINGSTKDDTLSAGSQISITLGVQANNWLGVACDYFVYCVVPSGKTYFLNTSAQWQLLMSAAYEGNSVDVSGYIVPNISSIYEGKGTYTFYFTMDNSQNGVMDGTQVTTSVRAIVQ